MRLTNDTRVGIDEMKYCFQSNNVTDLSGDDFSVPRRIVRQNGNDFIRQPCRARGVEIKPGQDPHVAKFAYIDIPVGAVHGAILSCCHEVCNSSGRRFRYCTHCQTAVAKRNFNVRHGHGNTNPTPSLRGRKANKVEMENVSVGGESNDQDYEPIDIEVMEKPAVPSLISVEPNMRVEPTSGDPNTRKEFSSNENDESMLTVSITREELEVINLLRWRRRHGKPGHDTQWERTLLKIAESASSRVIPEQFFPTEGTIDRTELDCCTPAYNKCDKVETSTGRSDLDCVDITSFFEA